MTMKSKRRVVQKSIKEDLRNKLLITYYSEDEILFNQLHSDQQQQKTIEIIYGEAVSIQGYKDLQYQTNAIKTQQYNQSNFLYSMLIKTFSRLYFFAMFIVFAIYVSDSSLSVRDQVEASFSVFFPFIFTYVVVSLREYYFEIRRAKKDKIVNQQQCTIIRKFREENPVGQGINKVQSLQAVQNQSLIDVEYKTQQKVQIYQHIKWEDLKIGDIVLLKKDDICPADMLILDMFDFQCTVNTQNIDDKSDEKIKTASELMFLPKTSKIKGNHVEYRKLLTGKFSFKGFQDSFKGLVKLKKDPIAQELTPDQFIMRGSQIQFTEWILGLVIEIGMQTYIYRKFKRPQIIYYNSTFMRKQFIFSAVSIMIIIILIFLNLAFTEVNQCLKDGFTKLDSKLVITALLHLPIYYHAVSESLITLYCIYINRQDEKKDEQYRQKSKSIEGFKNMNHFHFQQNQIGLNRQNSENSHIHLKKETELQKEENNTLAALKTQTEEKQTIIKIDDCFQQLNDTRSIVDMCLTTHLVFNTANTLTTGQNSITGLLISNCIYHVDNNTLKTLINRRNIKKDTLINFQILNQNPNHKNGLSYQNQSGITINGETTKQKSGFQSLAISFHSQNPLMINLNNLNGISQYGGNLNGLDLEKVVEESRNLEINSKGFNQPTDSKLSGVELTNNVPSTHSKKVHHNSRAPLLGGNFNKIQGLKKNYSLMVENTNINKSNEQQSGILESQNDQNQIQSVKIRDNPRSATSIVTGKLLKTKKNDLNIEEENFIQPSLSNIIPLPIIKNIENEAENLHTHNEIQNLLGDTPQSKSKEDQFFVNNLGEESNKNYIVNDNKLASTDYVQNDIEIEMHSTKDNNCKVTQNQLMTNPNISNFVNSLEYHKKNNHKIPQLVPKKISDLDSPFPESDGEVSSPRRAKKVAKLNRSTDFDLKNIPQQQRSTDGSNQTVNNQKNQMSDYLRNTVAKGVKKTLKNEELESNSNTQGSGKSTNNQNKFRTGSSTLRSLANQLNGGVDFNSILENKDFINIYTNEESENYLETHDILKAMLLCHYTRSFFDEDTQKITNRSFYHIEELQLQLGNSLGYNFEFSCFIDGEFHYVLKKDNSYFKYKVIAYHYYSKIDRFCILIQESEEVYSIYIKEEVTNISHINYLSENIISDLNPVCNYYRFQGNRSILYSKKEMDSKEVQDFISKMELQQNLSNLFNHELSKNVQYLTLVAVKEQTVPGLESLFKLLKEAKIKSWIATGEKQSKVIPICFSAGILDKLHKHIAFDTDEYDKLAFLIRNMLQQLKDGFQKAHNTQKQANEIISNLNININSGSNIQRESLNDIKFSQWQPGSSGINASKRVLHRSKSQSTTKHVRQASRKSIVSGMELENQFRFSLLVSGKSFKEIINSSYLYNHFAFICYFAHSVVGYDMTPELKAQLIKVINVKMNQNFKTMFIGDTLADFQAFTDSNISAHKKSSFNETQNYPGIQFDKVDNLLQILLFHSKMVSEIFEDALYFNTYRGILMIFVIMFQFQMCDIDYQMYNLGTMLFLSFFIVFIQSLIIVYKKYKKYQGSQLNQSGLIQQYGTLKTFSNQKLLLKIIKLIFITLIDSSAFYFFVHFILSRLTTSDGYTLTQQLINYIEQYFALAVIPYIRLLIEYQFKIKQALIVSFLLLAVPLLAFSFDPLIRIQIKESFILLGDAQFILTIFFIPFFIFSFNLLLQSYISIKSFPLIKSLQKLRKIIQDSMRESYFIKPKQFNIAKLIREIFQTFEPDIILSSYMLSEQVNLREASMNKYTLKFKDQNIEGRFLSQYKKISLAYSKTITTLSFIFIEIFILYRSILYTGASFSEFNPSFYTIYFLGAFFLFFIQIFIFVFSQKYQKYIRQVNYGIILIRIIYFMILINVADVYDSIPGILICIFLSIIMLPLIRLDYLFCLGILILLIVILREFNVISNQVSLQNDSSVKQLSVIHILLSHIEISFLFFICFLVQKRNYEEIERKNFQVNQTLTQATSKMKDTLSILLPRFIREKLYSGQNYDKISTNQGNVAILFCDITNFDEIMMQEEEKIVKVLDNLFRQFDKSCQSNQVLKIETVGKTYMAAAGLRDVDEYYQDGQNQVNTFVDPVKRCLQVAMEMQEIAKNTTWGNTNTGGKSGKVEIKVGINYGTVISGVIGFHKPQFSLIGDTVNTASRVCSTGVPKTINISNSSYQKVFSLSQYKFEKREVEAKGKGIIITYVVTQKTNTHNKKKGLQHSLQLQQELLNKLHPIVKKQQLQQLKDKTQENQNGQSVIQEASSSQKSKDKNDESPSSNSKNHNSEENKRKSRRRSGTYYIDSVSKFGALKMAHQQDNQENKQKTLTHMSQKLIKIQTLNNINEDSQKLIMAKDNNQTTSNNQIANKSQNNSSNNLNVRGRMNSIFLATSNQNIINLQDETIEPIHLAEQQLGVENKIDMQKVSNHGLNLQYYDLKQIKMQYQEEKDDISQGKQNNNKMRLNMSYWTGVQSQNNLAEINFEFDDMLSEFWTNQIDDSVQQMNGAFKLTFLQIFLYTLTLFFVIGPSKFNLIIAIRCGLIIFIIVAFLFFKYMLKPQQLSMNKFRTYIIIFYFIIFGALNLEIWMASGSTSKADTSYVLYNDTESKQIINVLIYEIYLVYYLFFRLRVFTFMQQLPVFLTSFIIFIIHNIMDDLIFQSIVIKVLFMQLCFTLMQYQLFKKDQENFNTLQSLNEKNQQTDKLIQYLLPKHILERFLMNPTASYIIAEKFDKQTILFADIAGFTRYSDQNQPETVVKMLRTIFTEFDQKCQYHKVFKVYTIGDCYVILGNTNHENRDPPTEAYNVIMMAFQMIEILKRTTELVDNQIDMRIGVHTGKIVGGLVGTQIVRYDIYGVDVMIANKMESNGQKGSVVVSETTKDILQERYGKEFIFTEKGDVYIKATDTNIRTYFCDKNPI
ncbi:hypothetical protein ABPG74_018791 [Tetrahymena malaccensis]